MPAPPLKANVRQQSHIAIIDLQGEINARAEDRLYKAYAEASDRQPTAIVLNFSGVNFITSTGVALIVGLVGRARQANHRLAAYGLNAHYLEIFQITRLTDFIEILPNEARLLGYIGE
jgi:anti-sigma B factor antagonist